MLGGGGRGEGGGGGGGGGGVKGGHLNFQENQSEIPGVKLLQKLHWYFIEFKSDFTYTLYNCQIFLGEFTPDFKILAQNNTNSNRSVIIFGFSCTTCYDNLLLWEIMWSTSMNGAN